MNSFLVLLLVIANMCLVLSTYILARETKKFVSHFADKDDSCEVVEDAEDT